MSLFFEINSTAKTMFSFHIGTTMTTFYPPDDTTHQMQTIINTAEFVSKTGLDKNLQYFKAGSQTIVIKVYKGIHFIVVSTLDSPKLLLNILHNVRNIAIFLFGLHFDEYMRDNISSAYQEVFSKYMDIYISRLKTDSRALLGIIKHDDDYSRISKLLSQKIPSSSIPENLQFVECIIFKNHEIVGRLSSPTTKPLTSFDVYQLSLFENAEFPESEPEMDADPDMIDPNYVTSVTPPSVRHRAGFFTIDNSVQRCSIAAGRMGPKSSYTALFITQNATANERRDLVMNVLGVITVSLKEGKIRTLPPNILLPPSLTCLLIVNRTNGECFETTPIMTDQSKKILNGLIKTMALKTAEAIPRGLLTLLWNDSLFDFCYEMTFSNETGSFVDPPKTVNTENSIFLEGRSLSYAQLTDELFGPVENFCVYEIYSIFLSTEQQSEVITISRHDAEQILMAKSLGFETKRKQSGKTTRSSSSFSLGLSKHTRQGSEPAFSLRESKFRSVSPSKA